MNFAIERTTTLEMVCHYCLHFYLISLLFIKGYKKSKNSMQKLLFYCPKVLPFNAILMLKYDIFQVAKIPALYLWQRQKKSATNKWVFCFYFQKQFNVCVFRWTPKKLILADIKLPDRKLPKAINANNNPACCVKWQDASKMSTPETLEIWQASCSTDELMFVTFCYRKKNTLKILWDRTSWYIWTDTNRINMCIVKTNS